MTNFLKETTVLDTLVRNTDHVARLGGGERSATYCCKIHCLCQKEVFKKNIGRIILAEGLCLEVKNTRRNLIPH
jgi:hypothetical protein